MNKTLHGWIGRLIAASLACLGPLAQAAAPVTADEILSNFPASLKETLQRGEIASFTRGEQEVDPSGLAIAIAIKVPAPQAQAAEKLRTLSPNKDPNEKIVQREIRAAPGSADLAKDFAEVSFDAAEQKELVRLLGATPGEDFNLSSEELGWIREAGKAFKPDAAPSAALGNAMANAYRRILASRYEAYRAHGLAGIATYAREDGKTTQASRELISITETMKLLRDKHPTLYRAVRNYPADGSDYVQHRYFWVKRTVDDRPQFSLRHEMTRVDPGSVYVIDRHYYMSHTLNALQVLILCLPYQDGTLIALNNQSFVDKVGGSFIGRAIGHRIVTSETMPLFDRLKAAFPTTSKN